MQKSGRKGRDEEDMAERAEEFDIGGDTDEEGEVERLPLTAVRGH